MVDFKWVKSFPNSEVDSLKAARLASMSPQFIANLVQRFSAYMGRLGQPDLNVDELKDHLLSEA